MAQIEISHALYRWLSAHPSPKFEGFLRPDQEPPEDDEEER